MCTGDNGRFIMLWQEVDFTRSSIANSENYLYTPHNKGGDYRKWYGNRYYFLKYNADSLKQMSECAGFRHDGKEYYFLPHVAWSKITSSKSSFRLFEEGFTFDSAGLGLFPVHSESLKTSCALLNSVVDEVLLGILNPTLNVTPIIVKQLPYLEKNETIEKIVDDCISLSRTDWDAFENSWDFQRHPLVAPALEEHATLLSDCWNKWEQDCEHRFQQLKSNEEMINHIFLNAFNLQDELNPEVDDKDVTVRRADFARDIRSLISYVVGCMFGRYSLDEPGLIYAGGTWDSSKYKSFLPDPDGILPICDDEYFEDDIVGLFVKFVQTVYGAETLEDNLNFIAGALGGKGSARKIIRNYFINDFFSDHCATYSVTGSGKRPIYWLLDSGKKNGFKCLVYMHRYQPDTFARIRTDYVHEQQSRYRTAITNLEQHISTASTSERVKLSKQLITLQAQAEEIRVYEEKIHHLADQMISINLDDGVKHNYEIFKDVLAKIK